MSWRSVRGMIGGVAVALGFALGAPADAAADDPPAAAPASDAPGAAQASAPPAAPSHPSWKRNGVNPCNTPDEGWGIYDHWSRAPSIGQMIAPQRGGITKSGGFDLVVHFHGHEPIRKEFVKTAEGIVLVGIDLGIGSGSYAQAFGSASVFEKLIASVEAEMARRTGNPKAHVRKLALTSWSAGYGAIGQILGQPLGKKVDAVVLLDSLYAGYADASQGTLESAQLEPFVKFARQAVAGKKLLFESYSSIQTPGYASTSQVAHYLVGLLGGKLASTKKSDVLGMEMFEKYDRSGWHVRGYRGQDKPDHCAHIGLMKDVVKKYLNARWSPPKGTGTVAAKKKKGQKALKPGMSVHVVTAGQSLRSISKRYKVTVAELREVNGLAPGKPLQIGEQLLLPKHAQKPKSKAELAAEKKAEKKADKAKKPDKASDKPAQKPKKKLKGKVHVVVAGQSLRAIAKRYELSVNELVAYNDLDRRKPLKIGQEIVIPEKAAPKAKPKADKPKASAKADKPKADAKAGVAKADGKADKPKADAKPGAKGGATSAAEPHAPVPAPAPPASQEPPAGGAHEEAP